MAGMRCCCDTSATTRSRLISKKGSPPYQKRADMLPTESGEALVEARVAVGIENDQALPQRARCVLHVARLRLPSGGVRVHQERDHLHAGYEVPQQMIGMVVVAAFAASSEPPTAAITAAGGSTRWRARAGTRSHWPCAPRDSTTTLRPST